MFCISVWIVKGWNTGYQNKSYCCSSKIVQPPVYGLACNLKNNVTYTTEFQVSRLKTISINSCSVIYRMLGRLVQSSENWNINHYNLKTIKFFQFWKPNDVVGTVAKPPAHWNMAAMQNGYAEVILDPHRDAPEIRRVLELFKSTCSSVVSLKQVPGLHHLYHTDTMLQWSHSIS